MLTAKQRVAVLVPLPGGLTSTVAAARRSSQRAKKTRERDAERARADLLSHNLGKFCRYLTIQGDPAELALVLAELDGPELPFSMLGDAAGWLTRFAEAYRDAVLYQSS